MNWFLPFHTQTLTIVKRIEKAVETQKKKKNRFTAIPKMLQKNCQMEEISFPYLTVLT